MNEQDVKNYAFGLAQNISVRQWLVGQALQGLAFDQGEPKLIAGRAIALADETLRQLAITPFKP